MFLFQYSPTDRPQCSLKTIAALVNKAIVSAYNFITIIAHKYWRCVFSIHLSLEAFFVFLLYWQTA